MTQIRYRHGEGIFCMSVFDIPIWTVRSSSICVNIKVNVVYRTHQWCNQNILKWGGKPKKTSKISVLFICFARQFIIWKLTPGKVMCKKKGHQNTTNELQMIGFAHHFYRHPTRNIYVSIICCQYKFIIFN